MKRLPVCVAAGATLFLIAFGLQSGADDDWEDRSPFQRRVAGTYSVAVDFGSGSPVLALATLNADGGVVATDTDDFGFEIQQRFHSPKHGSWTRSGRRSVTTTLYEYGFVEDENVPTLIFKLTLNFTYDDRTLTTGVGTVEYAAFLLPTLDPNADPLDPESGTVVAAGTGTMSFRRLE